MPYSTIIKATPGSLNAVLNYLTNATHDSHLDYELTPLKYWGVSSTEEFKDVCREGFSRNKQKGSGAPPQNAFIWFIVRMPDGANLTDAEKEAFEKAVIECGGMGGMVSAVHNWHENHYTGASDLNVLIPNFDKFGFPIRDRFTDPRKHLRWTMDQVTDRLNLAREADAADPIQTMKEVKREKARERGEIDVVEALAELDPTPTTEASLLHACLQLKFEISRYNSSGDSISITPEGKKKPKKFRISTLLEDIGQAVLRLVPKRKKKEKKKHTSKKGESAEQEDNIK